MVILECWSVLIFWHQANRLSLFELLACCAQYPLCINMMAAKKVDVLPLITHRFGFTPEDVAAAFDCAHRSAETRAIKVMFNLP